MLGNFEPAATDAALENCVDLVPDCASPVRKSHNGVSFYSWGENLGLNLQKRFSPPAFDQYVRGGRITIQDTHVFYTVETPGMNGLIEASLQTASLLAGCTGVPSLGWGDVPSWRPMHLFSVTNLCSLRRHLLCWRKTHPKKWSRE